MLAPESSDGVDQEVDGNRGRHDADCDCCVESRDVCLEEGHGTCDEKGVDCRDLVVERVFHPVRGVEYEDSWRGLERCRVPFVDVRGTHSNRTL